jgi:hypothetical protein
MRSFLIVFGIPTLITAGLAFYTNTSNAFLFWPGFFVFFIAFNGFLLLSERLRCSDYIARMTEQRLREIERRRARTAPARTAPDAAQKPYVFGREWA